MEIERSKQIVLSLANGLNPITGEDLDKNSVCNSPVIIRALFNIVSNIDPNRQCSIVKKTITKTITKKQQDNIEKGKPKNNGLPWTWDLRKKLEQMFLKRVSVNEMSKNLERTKGSILSKLVQEGLLSSEESKKRRFYEYKNNEK